MQGTRAAIDNLDTGVDSIPTVYSFRSPLQCASSILRNAGVSGFYRGIGAVGLQIAVYVLLFGTAEICLRYFELEDIKSPTEETK